MGGSVPGWVWPVRTPALGLEIDQLRRLCSMFPLPTISTPVNDKEEALLRLVASLIVQRVLEEDNVMSTYPSGELPLVGDLAA
jgi:hypothetical protein